MDNDYDGGVDDANQRGLHTHEHTHYIGNRNKKGEFDCYLWLCDVMSSAFASSRELTNILCTRTEPNVWRYSIRIETMKCSKSISIYLTEEGNLPSCWMLWTCCLMTTNVRVYDAWHYVGFDDSGIWMWIGRRYYVECEVMVTSANQCHSGKLTIFWVWSQSPGSGAKMLNWNMNKLQSKTRHWRRVIRWNGKLYSQNHRSS